MILKVDALNLVYVRRLGHDQFTVLQITNLALQLREIAPHGYLKVKDFAESIQRLITSTGGFDFLPESWLSLETLQIQQVRSTCYGRR
jgi:hypothetical protein